VIKVSQEGMEIQVYLDYLDRRVKKVDLVRKEMLLPLQKLKVFLVQRENKVWQVCLDLMDHQVHKVSLDNLD